MRILKLLSILLLVVTTSVFAQSGVKLQYERDDPNHGLVRGAGTAFGVDLKQYGLEGKRYLLTAAHNVISGHTRHDKITILINKEWVACTIINFDLDTDLCILKADKDLDLYTLANSDVKATDPLTMSASIRFMDIRIYKGVMLRHYFAGGSKSIMATKEYDHGASGAPILNSDNQVVGISLAGLVGTNGDIDENFALFLPVSSIHNVLIELTKEE